MLLKIIVILLAILLSFQYVLADNTGSLFIDCEAGFRVYLNENMAGITSDDQGGIWLTDLPVGKINVRMQKRGYNPVFFMIEILHGQTVERIINADDYREMSSQQEDKKRSSYHIHTDRKWNNAYVNVEVGTRGRGAKQRYWRVRALFFLDNNRGAYYVSEQLDSEPDVEIHFTGAEMTFIRRAGQWRPQYFNYEINNNRILFTNTADISDTRTIDIINERMLIMHDKSYRLYEF